MLTRPSIEAFRGQNANLAKAGVRDLRAFWRALDLAVPEGARDALLEYVPQLVARYGDLSAAMAADFYDDARALARARGAFRAVMADNVPADVVQQRVRFGAQHLWTEQQEQALKFLEGVAQEYILQPGRDTIAVSAARDPSRPRWARVPDPGACEFCLMLASRGYAYGSEDAAGGTYHANCNCTAVPSWDGDVEGYDPDALYREYAGLTADGW